MLEAGLYSQLAGDSDITDLVGTRIYPIKMPQQPTYPAMTFQRISTVPLTQSHDGANHLTRCRMQFDVFATTLLAAKQIADELRGSIDGQSGTWGTVTVAGCWRENEQDFWEPETDRYRVLAEYMITFLEA